MGNNLEQLEMFYSSQHKERIFCSRLCVQGKSFDILYDYDKKTPLIPTWDKEVTDSLYVYRIKKNNRFRAPGP